MNILVIVAVVAIIAIIAIIAVLGSVSANNPQTYDNQFANDGAKINATEDYYIPTRTSKRL